MLEGVDIYKDRDKYLLRSLQVTGRMENLIREMLEISRMQGGSAALNCEQVDLAVLIERQLVLDAGLLEQPGQRLVTELTPGITVSADVSLLSKVVGNLAANASLYSPEGAEIRVWVRHFAGASHPDGGEQRCPHRAGGPAAPVRGLLPRRRLPAIRAPAGSGWGCIW